MQDEHKQYLKEIAKQAADLINAATEKRCTFYQHILLVSITVFAIVISLHKSNSGGGFISYIFASSTILLALGVLSIALVYKDNMWYAEEARNAFAAEALKAIDEKRAVSIVSGKIKRRTRIFEYVGSVSLILSAIGFTLYSVIGAFS
ncbi:MAG: hypothetical protein WC833_08755 [Bacteroidales bacterium]|jgi:hypothetical protein